MNGKQLKNSILQWAIQGKLVPQDPNDESASVLLERIRTEKARLVKEGKIKKDKNESIIFRGDDNSHYEKFLATGEVKCIDDEIPFEIPEGWEWCRLGFLSEIIGGYAFESSSLKASFGDRVIRISDIDETGFVNNKIVRYNGTAISEAYRIKKLDILLAMTGGTVGKSLYVKTLPEDSLLLNQRVAIIRNRFIDSDYLDLVIKSPHIKDVINSRKNSTNDNISMTDIYNFLIPIPAVRHQTVIVKAFSDILPLIDRYGVAKFSLDRLNTNIKATIQKSVLQEAIQGKLVPQDPADEPASVLLDRIREEKQRLLKEGKLKKKDITDSIIFKGDDNKYSEKVENDVLYLEDDIPFEIPETWAWVRLNDICEYIQRGKSPKYSEIKKYPVVAQKCNQWSGFSLEKALFIDPDTLPSYGQERFLQHGDLLWNSTGLGTLGRMAIYNESVNPYGVAVADSHVTVIRPIKSFINFEYLYLYFSSNEVQSVIEDKADGSTKQKELATKTIKSYLVPLPPLNEQYRIVAKYHSVASIMRG